MRGLPGTMARGALHLLTSKGIDELTIRNPVAVKTLRHPRRQLDPGDGLGHALRVKNDEIAGVASAVVNETHQPAIAFTAAAWPCDHDKFAGQPARSEVVHRAASRSAIVAYQAAIIAPGQIVIGCDRIDDVVRVSDATLVDAGKFDGSVIQKILLRLARAGSNGPAF